MNTADLWLRVRALLFRHRVETELEEELRFHLAMQTRKNLAAGMSVAEARRQARVQFGPDASVKEECRDARRVNMIDTVGQDIRYALRGFRRSPTFVLTVIATIALGLGLNTTVFTIFNAYVLRPIAVRDPYSLYEFFWENRSGRAHAFTWPEYEAFRKQKVAFSEMYALRHLQLRIEGHQAFGELISGDYFRMLGVGAALGRTLVPEDCAIPGREPVIVLSYTAWQNQFASDPGILGRKVSVRGYPLEVIGVAREGFGGMEEIPDDFWAPLSMIAQIEDGPDLFGPAQPERLRIVGRLKPGLAVKPGQAALTAWSQRLTADHSDPEKAIGAILRSRATSVHLSPRGRLTLSPILAAFGLVLLIACANVANLMLARAMARQREIGIRLSLGAARSRLIRQLLTESVLLALPAAALGFAISQGTIEFGVRMLFATLPSEFAEYIRITPLSPDLRVFLFMVGAAVLSALLFGLAPAMQATRASVVQAARGDFANEFRPARLRNALVVVQVTACVLLLICAGVLLRGAQRVRSLDTGMRTHDVVEIEITEKPRLRALAQLASEPLVQSVAASSNVPLDGRFPTLRVSAAGASNLVRAPYNDVSPGYFTVLGIPILRGRSFTSEEAQSGASVAVVSQTAAQRLWPDRDAIGQALRLQPDPHGPRGAATTRYASVRVIGIARDTITGLVGDDTGRTCLYFPTTPRTAGSALLLRVNGDVEQARQRLDAALTAIDPGTVTQIHKMREFVVGRDYPFRAAYWIAAAVGVLAMLLTIAGIYGVLSYLVTQRRKEIGIRMALGATATAVTRLVLKQSVRLAALGILSGVVLALGASRFFASQLEMMNTFDAYAYAAGVVVVLAACLASAYFPSRRAARIDPMSTLRYD